MSKEIKKTLKEARDAIKSKDYTTCVKQCKWVLKEDPENYMALVLIGAAYQETDFKQAHKSFRRAIQISPLQILAWQGLANCLEKQNPTEELAEAYGKLLEIECEKNLEVCQKLVSLCNRLPNLNPCIKALQGGLSANKKSDNEINKNVLQIYSALAQVLMNLESLPTEHQGLLEDTLSILIAHPEVENHCEFCRWQLRHLFYLKKTDELWERAKVMHDLYPQDSYPLEWICKLYVERQLDDYYAGCSKLEIDIGRYITSVNNIKKSYEMSQLAEAVMLLLKGDFVTARDMALKVTATRPGWLHALYALSVCYHKLAAWSSSEQFCTRALGRVMPISAPFIKVHLDEMLIESLIKQEHVQKLEKALEKCDAILLKTPTERNILYFHQYTKALLAEDKYELPPDTVMNDFTDFQKILLQSIAQRTKNHHGAALQTLLEGLKEKQLDTYEEAALLIECGKCYKLLNKLDESLVSFLKSARLNQFSADVFYYIAECYTLMNVEDGIERAKKCLQRSMHFDCLHPKAGSVLSRLYRQNNQTDENLALLQNAVSNGRSIETKWAWLQLGLHHLSYRDYDAAINSLRVVIRIDPNDARCWESLADAYLNRGSYVSAQKSFRRALEINPDSVYAKIRVANINQSLGQLREAITWYNEVLHIDDRYLLALKGLGETYYLLAKQALKQRMIGLCRKYCQLAVDNLFNAIRTDNKFVCLYRLFANCITLVLCLPDYYSWLEISKEISADHDGEKLYKLELFDLAKKFYYQTLKMSVNNDNVWNELAINHHDHAVYLASVDESKSDVALELLNKGFAIAKKAVVLAPGKWQHWNTLGYVACNKLLNRLALAQHCFIKAINIGKDTAVAWTNLGVLYAQYGDLVLANKAFARAQESDPGYVGSWVGQSFLAQRLANDEALDLFRHSVQLAFRPECCLAYASLVCETMRSASKMSEFRYRFAVHDMQAVVLSLDVLAWCLEHYGWMMDDDGKVFDLKKIKGKETQVLRALTLLGHLRSHEKLYKGAEKAFIAALRLCGKEHHDQILVNLAKVQLKLSEPEKALETLSNVKEATYVSACTLAQVYFQCGQYEQCYATYESALEWLCENEHQKNNLIVCMARLAYAFQGPSETKILLFQCLAAKPPPRHALFAACSLGILHQDATLTELSLSEIGSLVNYDKSNENEINQNNNTALFLHLQYCLASKKQLVARSLLLHALRLRPVCGETRLMLAKLLLLDKSKEAGKLAAMFIKTYLEAIQKDSKRDGTTQALIMVSKAELQSGNLHLAKVWAQRAIFRSPDKCQPWSVLLDTQLAMEPTQSDYWTKLGIYLNKKNKADV